MSRNSWAREVPDGKRINIGEKGGGDLGGRSFGGIKNDRIFLKINCTGCAMEYETLLSRYMR